MGYPSGAELDSNAPFNDKSNGFDLSHLCPSCDEDIIEEEIAQTLDGATYEDDEDHESACEELRQSTSLCKECHRLKQSEY